MSGVHLVCAWLLACAVVLHLAAVVKHALVDHDGVLARMGVGRGQAPRVTSARAD